MEINDLSFLRKKKKLFKKIKNFREVQGNYQRDPLCNVQEEYS
jgi:hypothetical protein